MRWYYHKTSNIIRTFFYHKIALKVGCVLYIGLDIFCSLFQIETIVENETAELQQRRRRQYEWQENELAHLTLDSGC